MHWPFDLTRKLCEAKHEVTCSIPGHGGRVSMGEKCTGAGVPRIGVQIDDTQVVDINTESPTTACLVNRGWLRHKKKKHTELRKDPF